MRGIRAPIGLVGRIVAILLLALAVEFGVSTLLYEQATQFSVRDDEARRLAEHLVISRRLVGERAPAARGAMAADLSTDRYVIRWEPATASPPPTAPDMEAVRNQVVAWEPALTPTGLRLQRASPGRRSILTGALRLGDGSWMQFRTLEPVVNLNLARQRVVLALLPAVALMALGGLMIRQTLLPLRRLAEAADRVGARGRHEPEPPVAEDGPEEVRRVVAAFNRMQARIQRLIADRTRALAAVGHDLRTPLARLKLRSDAIEADEVRAALAADIEEMDAMIASLLAFLGGENDPERPVRSDLAVTCATLVDDAIDRGHDAVYDGPDHCEWTVRPIGMKRALANLVVNAIHYGRTLTVSLVDREDGIVIRVEDDGPGIPPDRLAAVIEPFVRLDSARHRDTKGFGLGLSIVAKTVAREGGQLTLSNRETGGLRAEILLPRRST